jgi:hypothetical protein
MITSFLTFISVPVTQNFLHHNSHLVPWRATHTTCKSIRFCTRRHSLALTFSSHRTDFLLWKHVQRLRIGIWDSGNAQCAPDVSWRKHSECVNHYFYLTCEWRACVCSAYKTTMEYSGVCYNERMLQWTVFINKIRMLQRKRRNTIGRRSMRVRMTCRAFPLCLERQSSSLLSFVRFSYQFSCYLLIFAFISENIYVFFNYSDI